MRQAVVITRLADRHATPHGRDYAESCERVVSAGSLDDVLAQLRGLDMPVGRYSLTVSEPFDP